MNNSLHKACAKNCAILITIIYSPYNKNHYYMIKYYFIEFTPSARSGVSKLQKQDSEQIWRRTTAVLTYTIVYVKLDVRLGWEKYRSMIQLSSLHCKYKVLSIHLRKWDWVQILARFCWTISTLSLMIYILWEGISGL